MKWTKKQKEEVKDCFQGWLSAYQIMYTGIHYHFMEEGEETEESQTNCSISSGYPYKWITLGCFPPMTEKDYSKEKMHMDLLHEIQHLVLAPMDHARLKPDDIYTDGMEQSVEHLACWAFTVTKRCWDLQDEVKKLKRSQSRSKPRKKSKVK